MPERKLAAIVIAATMIAVALLAVAYHRTAPTPQPALRAADSPVHRLPDQAGADLDGDGKPETIQSGQHGVRVTAGTGAILLDSSEPVLGDTLALKLGGEYPALFVRTTASGWAAYAYSPGLGIMSRVTWPDGQQYGYGELTTEGAFIPAAARGGRREAIPLSLDRLQLISDNSSPVTAKARRGAADTLKAAVETVLLGLAPDELAIYFTSRDTADSFLRQWQHRLSMGTVRVAQPDDLNAGAENGHRVPVAIWIDGPKTVAGLSGEVSFAPGSSGFLIREITLRPIALQVHSRTEALARLKQAKLALQEIEPLDRPFFGGFYFKSGSDSYVIDAITGKVDRGG